MRILPKVVQTLVPQSADVQRVRDTLTTSLQPTLNFLNTYFAAASDGTLRIISAVGMRAATIADSLIVNGNATVNGNVNVVGGQLYVQNAAGRTDVVTIVPTTAGQVMKITNIGNTQVNIGALSDGTWTALAFISANGFKSFLDGGTYSNANCAASTWYQHQRIAIRGSAIASQNLVQPMGYSGSVIGIMMQYQGGSTQNISIKVQKNNADLWVYNNIYTGAGNGALVTKTQNKGVSTFNAQDFLTVLSSYSGTGDVALQVTLIIEQTA